MGTRYTYCRICEAACGLKAEVAGDRLIALGPDPEHVASRGFACAKGTRFGEMHASPDRLDAPLVRRGGRLVSTDLASALGDAGTQLRKIRDRHGPHSIAVYMGNPAAFGFMLPLASLGFVRAFGTRNFFTAASLDCNNKFFVARHVLGSAMTHPVPDFDHASFALLIGTNPAVSQSSFVHAPRIMERLGAIERRGGRVIVVDPRRTETARSVGEWVPIRPDTDAALLLGLLHVIFDERLEQDDVLARHGAGVTELRRAVRAFDPERVAAATGIDATRIRELARAFALADGAFCHLSTGVNMGRFGNIAYAAKIALELVTGNLDRRGGALLPRGALDTAGLARRFGLDREPRVRSRIGDFSPILGALPTAILADEILEPGPDRVRALVVVAGNPLLSAPDGQRLRRAFGELELLVVLDLFANDTAEYATHVLPCTDFLEREDFPLSMLQLQPEPFLGWTDAVVPPRGERRPEWWLLGELARLAKLPLFGNRALDLAARTLTRGGSAHGVARALLLPMLGPRALERLRANPHGLRLPEERPGEFLSRRIGTRSRRVELFPPVVWQRLAELETTLDHPAPPAADGVLRLLLFTKREKNGHNSWMHASARLATDPHAAHLHPDDGARLGLTDGDRVELATPSGRIELPAALTRDVVPGAIAVPHGYGHATGSGWRSAVARGGANVNDLAPSGPSAVDAQSGMCRFVGVSVEVRRVAARTVQAAE